MKNISQSFIQSVSQSVDQCVSECLRPLPFDPSASCLSVFSINGDLQRDEQRCQHMLQHSLPSPLSSFPSPSSPNRLSTCHIPRHGRATESGSALLDVHSCPTHTHTHTHTDASRSLTTPTNTCVDTVPKGMSLFAAADTWRRHET